jgi:hypothetical protein
MKAGSSYFDNECVNPVYTLADQLLCWRFKKVTTSVSLT